MRVGILTGGGDCPGLNAVIRAIVRKGELNYGDELIGFDGGGERRASASALIVGDDTVSTRERNKIRDRGIDALLASPHLAGLTSLSVSGNELRFEGTTRRLRARFGIPAS